MQMKWCGFLLLLLFENRTSCINEVRASEVVLLTMLGSQGLGNPAPFPSHPTPHPNHSSYGRSLPPIVTQGSFRTRASAFPVSGNDWACWL